MNDGADDSDNSGDGLRDGRVEVWANGGWLIFILAKLARNRKNEYQKDINAKTMVNKVKSRKVKR